MQRKACKHLLLSFFFLCVTPWSQEHDSPDGVLGGGAGAGAGARHGDGGRGPGGGDSPPELVTEGLLDLVSPGGAGGRFPGEVRGFHGEEKEEEGRQRA